MRGMDEENQGEDRGEKLHVSLRTICTELGKDADNVHVTAHRALRHVSLLYVSSTEGSYLRQIAM